MKITQKIRQSDKENKIWWSFEYFPPRTAQVRKFDLAGFIILTDSLLLKGLQNLLDRIERMRALGPEFIDITWCAPRYRSTGHRKITTMP
jgi:methylenetetrahydrofolate reductase (NADPH)